MTFRSRVRWAREHKKLGAIATGWLAVWKFLDELLPIHSEHPIWKYSWDLVFLVVLGALWLLYWAISRVRRESSLPRNWARLDVGPARRDVAAPETRSYRFVADLNGAIEVVPLKASGLPSWLQWAERDPTVTGARERVAKVGRKVAARLALSADGSVLGVLSRGHLHLHEVDPRTGEVRHWRDVELPGPWAAMSPRLLAVTPRGTQGAWYALRVERQNCADIVLCDIGSELSWMQIYNVAEKARGVSAAFVGSKLVFTSGEDRRGKVLALTANDGKPQKAEVKWETKRWCQAEEEVVWSLDAVEVGTRQHVALLVEDPKEGSLKLVVVPADGGEVVERELSFTPTQVAFVRDLEAPVLKILLGRGSRWRVVEARAQEKQLGASELRTHAVGLGA